jgi:hypothetical protein
LDSTERPSLDVQLGVVCRRRVSPLSEPTVLERLSAALLGRPPSPFFARNRGGARAARPYLVATAGRSGSTFLCARIAEYAELGFPREFLNESFLAEFDRIFPNPNLADYRPMCCASSPPTTACSE